VADRSSLGTGGHGMQLPLEPHARRSTTGSARPAPRVLGAAGIVLLLLAVASFSMHLRNDVYLRRATDSLFAGPGDDEEKAKRLAHFVATQAATPIDPDSASLEARIEHKLPLEISPVTVLKEGFAFPDARRYGPCGQMSRTIRAVGWLRGIASHKVLTGAGGNEHAMVALYVNGAYRLFDPASDFYWTDHSGHVADVDSVRADTSIFNQVYRSHPHYPYDLHDATYFRWRRLGPPGLWLRAALVRVLGERRVALFDTPKLYERPWWGYGWASLLAAIGCFVAYALAARRSR